MEGQIQEFQERTGITCTLRLEPEDLDLDAARSTTVFRIVQEALTNVARHADATQVDIGLHLRQEMLCLDVRDNGRGIPAQALDDPQSFGLLGIRERVLHWHGDVHIQGSQDRGTVLTVRIPVAERQEVVAGVLS
jgi:signal transduction histidine kinase